ARRPARGRPLGSRRLRAPPQRSPVASLTGRPSGKSGALSATGHPARLGCPSSSCPAASALLLRFPKIKVFKLDNYLIIHRGAVSAALRPPAAAPVGGSAAPGPSALPPPGVWGTS